MIKEQVLSALGALGFIPEEIEEFGYRFDYEGLTMLYSTEDDDTKCITLITPNIFEISDDSHAEVLEAMVNVCGRVKYAQPHIMFGNQVWINYQHHIGENEVTPDLIEHMIRVLSFATSTFHKILNGDDNDD